MALNVCLSAMEGGCHLYNQGKLLLSVKKLSRLVLIHIRHKGQLLSSLCQNYLLTNYFDKWVRTDMVRCHKV